MKQVLAGLAALGYLVCVVWALWRPSARLYFTEAYVGMSCCALAAVLCVSRPQRWLPIAALLFGLMGGFVCWQSNARAGARTGNLSQTQAASGQTWIEWSSTVGGNNHWYALTPSATNWLDAQDLAVSWGGNLATIRSDGEQDFINATFLTGALEHRPVWIGLVRTGAHGNLTSRVQRAMEDLGILHPKAAPASAFEWVSGEPLSYSNWKPGQPDNFPPGEEYVTINWHHSDSPPRGTKGDWNDAPLNGTTGFGGTTDGPYFGLVERESDPNRPPILTPSQLRLVTVAWLLLAAPLAIWLSRAKRERRTISGIIGSWLESPHGMRVNNSSEEQHGPTMIISNQEDERMVGVERRRPRNRRCSATDRDTRRCCCGHRAFFVPFDQGGMFYCING
jgi:hypothetical protein